MLHGIGWKVKLEITIEITENTPLKIPFKSATQEGGIKMFGLLVAFYPGVKKVTPLSNSLAEFTPRVTVDSWAFLPIARLPSLGRPYILFLYVKTIICLLLPSDGTSWSYPCKLLAVPVNLARSGLAP